MGWHHPEPELGRVVLCRYGGGRHDALEEDRHNQVGWYTLYLPLLPPTHPLYGMGGYVSCIIMDVKYLFFFLISELLIMSILIRIRKKTVYIKNK